MTPLVAVAVTVLLPLLVAPVTTLPGRSGEVARRIAAWAAVPALVVALIPADLPTSPLPWLLLGARFGLDPIGRTFLLLFGLLWTVSGLYARAYVPEAEQRRFFLFYLLTMAGNLGLPLAADAVSFYLLFALMTFSAYGLIVHRGDAEARRAGRIYIIMAVGGEAFLLMGLLLATGGAGTLQLELLPSGLAGSAFAGTAILCLLIGFGIKGGAVPLHVWLPLAHPVAPTPASAVLSGSMIKAGLLGWIRFLPLGEAPYPVWGTVIVLAGLAAAFFGVMIGILQTDPKTVLAYSSISQMGIINIGVGIALSAPEAFGAVVPALGMFAVHHGLAKGALFLGVGVVGGIAAGRWERSLALVALTLPALAIAGAPLTSGHVAKGNLKALTSLTMTPVSQWLDWLLPLSALATTLLMARFFILLLKPDPMPHPLARGAWGSWAALVLAVVLAGVLLPVLQPPDGLGGYAGSGAVLDVAMIAGGVVVAWLSWIYHREPRWEEPLVAPGDMVNPLERWLVRTARSFDPPEPRRDPVLTITSLWYQLYRASDRHDLLLRLEMRITRWAPAILMLALVTALILAVLSRTT